MAGPIGTVLLFVVFFLVMFGGLGSVINQIGIAAATSTGATGIWALFLANLNLVIIVIALLGLMGYMYFAQ